MLLKVGLFISVVSRQLNLKISQRSFIYLTIRLVYFVIPESVTSPGHIAQLLILHRFEKYPLGLRVQRRFFNATVKPISYTLLSL